MDSKALVKTDGQSSQRQQEWIVAIYCDSLFNVSFIAIFIVIIMLVSERRWFIYYYWSVGGFMNLRRCKHAGGDGCTGGRVWVPIAVGRIYRESYRGYVNYAVRTSGILFNIYSML